MFRFDSLISFESFSVLLHEDRLIEVKIVSRTIHK